MQLNPYLMFNGQCEAAFKFYERCLDGKIVAIGPMTSLLASDHPWVKAYFHGKRSRAGQLEAKGAAGEIVEAKR